MAVTDTIEYLEHQIRLATRLIDGGLLEQVYLPGPRLEERISYWEGVRVRAEEKLYNLRHGDKPCLPTDLEE